jgi:hypothetical protein
MTTLLIALAVFGIATIMVEYDGPGMVFARLRASRIGKLFGCSVCLVPWFVAVFAVIFGLGVIEALGAMGLAVILARNL